jgi:hypothetical protein
MSDPGGGHGWRSARHMPRQRGGALGLGRLAERALPGEERPLCVLLLPRPLEDLAARERIERLAAAPGVVAVDPPRLSYGTAARLPGAVADGLANVQARRMNLPGVPYAVAVFEALQYPLARALLALYPDAELWYAGEGGGTLHELAADRAAMRFALSGDDRPLWERMERLGIASGRLGSERPDVT